MSELEKRDINIDACTDKFTELEFHAILKQLVAESNVEVKVKKENGYGKDWADRKEESGFQRDMKVGQSRARQDLKVYINSRLAKLSWIIKLQNK